MGQRSKTLLQTTLFLFSAAALSACGNGETTLPTPDINDLVTRAVFQTVQAESAAEAMDSAAQTVSSVILPSAVSMTEEISMEEEIMIERRTATPTEYTLPVLPGTTNLLPAITETSAQVMIPTMEIVSTEPPSTPQNRSDKAAYEGQSPEDGTHVEAGSEFDIAWYLRNVGTTTWTTDYTCRYFTGTDFTKPGKKYYPLTGTVRPDEVGCCIVDALAPEEPGPYKMSVVLGNENEENFTIVDITIWVD